MRLDDCANSTLVYVFAQRSIQYDEKSTVAKILITTHQLRFPSTYCILFLHLYVMHEAMR